MAELGTELSCVNDIDAAGRVVSGNRALAEAVARRWLTPRGRLIGYPNYGYDLTQWINADMSDRDLAELRSNAEAEALKDERLLSCDVTAVIEADNTLTVVGSLESAEGPFTMTVSVSDVTLKLLDVT